MLNNHDSTILIAQPNELKDNQNNPLIAQQSVPQKVQIDHEKQLRLAKALKINLLKRKAQIRARNDLLNP